MKIKTVIRVFSEDQIPDDMLAKIQRIKAEYKAMHPVKSAPPPPLLIPTTPRPEFLEPISPVGMVSPKTSMKMMQEYEQKNMEEFYQWEIQQPSTWVKQMEVFENHRSKITKKGRLSASDLEELEVLDEKIEYCENTLAELENDYFEDSE